MSKSAILIVEDDPTWQHILSELAEDMGCRSQIANTYQAAARALRKSSFALATIDISLSLAHHDNRDGLAILRDIAQSLPAIVITGYPSLSLAVEVLADLKALHFFTKDDFNRHKFIQVATAEIGQTPPPRKLNHQILHLLSDREREVLYRLSEGQTNKEIAAALVVTVNTIKKHVQSIFTKLNVNTRAAAVSYALEGARHRE